MLLLLAFAVSVPSAPVTQGGTLRVLVSGAPAKALRLEAFGRERPFFPLPDGTLRALVGTTPQTPPGTHALTVRRRRLLGPDEVASATVTIAGREFGAQSLSMPDSKIKLTEDPKARAATVSIREAVRTASPLQRWEGPFREPVSGRRSSGYGLSRTVNKTRPWNWHRGLDTAAPAGTPVVAPASGTVVIAGQYPMQGGTVVLDHGQGVFSVLMHMGKVSVRAGQGVQAAQPLGEVGSEGFSTGAHMHWGLYVGGEAVDPGPWLRTAF